MFSSLLSPHFFHHTSHFRFRKKNPFPLCYIFFSTSLFHRLFSSLDERGPGKMSSSPLPHIFRDHSIDMRRWILSLCYFIYGPMSRVCFVYGGRISTEAFSAFARTTLPFFLLLWRRNERRSWGFFTLFAKKRERDERKSLFLYRQREKWELSNIPSVIRAFTSAFRLNSVDPGSRIVLWKLEILCRSQRCFKYGSFCC